MKSSKPILIGGIGLSIGLWFLNSLDISMFQFEEFGTLSAIALGYILWLGKKRAKTIPPILNVSSLTIEDVQTAITQTQEVFKILEKEVINTDISSLKKELDCLPNLLQEKALQTQFKINIVGSKYAGKTTLKELLNKKLDQEIIFTETLDHDLVNSEILNQDNDITLFLITGDLTESQWQVIQKLKDLHHRLILLLNKQDRYLPEEIYLILQQIKEKVKNVISEKDILAMATSPIPIKVKQHQKDGKIKEWMENQVPQIDNIINNLQHILTEETEQLKLEKTWRNAFVVKEKIKNKINEIRKERSLPIIEKYQWIAATATFANPISSLDLLATAAINGQLLVDLSEIYQQKFSLDQAQNSASLLGKLMMQLGLVEISTQTITSVLKSNPLTYIAGGTIQGMSAAYLTRIAGLSLIEYYQEQDILNTSTNTLNLEKIGEKLKKVFQENQRIEVIKSFLKEGLKLKSA